MDVLLVTPYDAIVHDSTLRYAINSSSFNNTLV